MDREVYAAERLDGAVALVRPDERDDWSVWRTVRRGLCPGVIP
jgi:hypothetical protein